MNRSPSEHEWYRPRKYVHFDHPAQRCAAAAYVQDPSKVSCHSFHPFICYKKTTRRYRKKLGKVKIKERPIAYASHWDSHVFAWYAAILGSVYEARLSRHPTCSQSILAYRKLGKCNIHFVAEVFDQIERLSPCVVKTFDISGFFDNLQHNHLKSIRADLLATDRLPADHFKVFTAITNYASVDRERLFEEFAISRDLLRCGLNRICTPAEFRARVRGKNLIAVNSSGHGIPQGSPISAILSNIYMWQFDQEMAQLADSTGGVYRRYSDDILWICPPNGARHIESAVVERIQALGLKIASEKVETSRFQRTGSELACDAPLQYLGFTFDGCRRLIRTATLARYYRRLRRAVRVAVRNANASPADVRVYRRRLYEEFTHLGQSNFITAYGQRAATIMKSENLRRQIGKHWRKIHQWLSDDH